MNDTYRPPVNQPWRSRAACSGADVDLFFDPNTTAEALSYCNRCPVREQCLEWALARGESDGVLGGLTERQRARHAHQRGLEWPRERDLPSDRGRNCSRPGCAGRQFRESLCETHLQARHDARRRKEERTQTLAQAHRIIDHIAVKHGMKPYEVTGRGREGDVVEVRHQAMAEIRDRLGLSYADIGRLFDGRDHSTVLSAIGKQVAA